MSDQDNLRDRIKRIIDVHDEKFFDGDYPTTLAQAITDEFGMTVETRNDGCTACGEPPESRIVGKWEKQ